MSKNTLRDVYRLMALPADVQSAISTLCDHGADFDKALTLVDPHKRGRGRPPKKTSVATTPKHPGAPDLSPLPMQVLAELVDHYKSEDIASTDRGAIKEFLNDYSKSCGKPVSTICANQRTRNATKMTPEKFVRALAERLSRYRSKVAQSLQNSD
jgi:hypothetical protein